MFQGQPKVSKDIAMKGQNLSPRCHLPWQSMVIDSYGQVMPCGYWKAFRNNNPYCGNLEDNSLLEIWNGEVYRRLRKNMAAGDLEAAGCVKCFALEQGIPMGLMYDEDADCEQPPRTGYAKNIHLLKEEISMEAMSLKAQPTVISLTPSNVI